MGPWMSSAALVGMEQAVTAGAAHLVLWGVDKIQQKVVMGVQQKWVLTMGHIFF